MNIQTQHLQLSWTDITACDPVKFHLWRYIRKYTLTI